MEMLKGRVEPPPKHHKGTRIEDMNTVGEKGVRGAESGVKKGKQWNTSESRAGERGGKRPAPFPPKKRRVKRWTLYK